jgi:hypothetical protein
MKKFLFVVLNPYSVDFSKPGMPPGLTAEKVDKEIQIERERLKSEGYDTEQYLFDQDKLDIANFGLFLNLNSFDGILIVVAKRLARHNFISFEKIVNAIHENG